MDNNNKYPYTSYSTDAYTKTSYILPINDDTIAFVASQTAIGNLKEATQDAACMVLNIYEGIDGNFIFQQWETNWNIWEKGERDEKIDDKTIKLSGKKNSDIKKALKEILKNRSGFGLIDPLRSDGVKTDTNIRWTLSVIKKIKGYEMTKCGHRFLLDDNSLEELTEDRNTLRLGTYTFLDKKGNEITDNTYKAQTRGKWKAYKDVIEEGVNLPSIFYKNDGNTEWLAEGPRVCDATNCKYIVFDEISKGYLDMDLKTITQNIVINDYDSHFYDPYKGMELPNAAKEDARYHIFNYLSLVEQFLQQNTLYESLKTTLGIFLDDIVTLLNVLVDEENATDRQKADCKTKIKNVIKQIKGRVDDETSKFKGVFSLAFTYALVVMTQKPMNILYKTVTTCGPKSEEKWGLTKQFKDITKDLDTSMNNETKSLPTKFLHMLFSIDLGALRGGTWPDTKLGSRNKKYIPVNIFFMKQFFEGKQSIISGVTGQKTPYLIETGKKLSEKLTQSNQDELKMKIFNTQTYLYGIRLLFHDIGNNERETSLKKLMTSFGIIDPIQTSVIKVSNFFKEHLYKGFKWKRFTTDTIRRKIHEINNNVIAIRNYYASIEKKEAMQSMRKIRDILVDWKDYLEPARRKDIRAKMTEECRKIKHKITNICGDTRIKEFYDRRRNSMNHDEIIVQYAECLQYQAREKLCELSLNFYDYIAVNQSTLRQLDDKEQAKKQANEKTKKRDATTRPQDNNNNEIASPKKKPRQSDEEVYDRLIQKYNIDITDKEKEEVYDILINRLYGEIIELGIISTNISGISFRLLGFREVAKELIKDMLIVNNSLKTINKEIIDEHDRIKKYIEDMKKTGITSTALKVKVNNVYEKLNKLEEKKKKAIGGTIKVRKGRGEDQYFEEEELYTPDKVEINDGVEEGEEWQKAFKEYESKRKDFKLLVPSEKKILTQKIKKMNKLFKEFEFLDKALKQMDEDEENFDNISKQVWTIMIEIKKLGDVARVQKLTERRDLERKKQANALTNREGQAKQITTAFENHAEKVKKLRKDMKKILDQREKDEEDVVELAKNDYVRQIEAIWALVGNQKIQTEAQQRKQLTEREKAEERRRIQTKYLLLDDEEKKRYEGRLTGARDVMKEFNQEKLDGQYEDGYENDYDEPMFGDAPPISVFQLYNEGFSAVYGSATGLHTNIGSWRVRAGCVDENSRNLSYKEDRIIMEDIFAKNENEVLMSNYNMGTIEYYMNLVKTCRLERFNIRDIIDYFDGQEGRTMTGIDDINQLLETIYTLEIIGWSTFRCSVVLRFIRKIPLLFQQQRTIQDLILQYCTRDGWNIDRILRLVTPPTGNKPIDIDANAMVVDDDEDEDDEDDEEDEDEEIDEDEDDEDDEEDEDEEIDEEDFLLYKPMKNLMF